MFLYLIVSTLNTKKNLDKCLWVASGNEYFTQILLIVSAWSLYIFGSTNSWNVNF